MKKKAEFTGIKTMKEFLYIDTTKILIISVTNTFFEHVIEQLEI